MKAAAQQSAAGVCRARRLMRCVMQEIACDPTIKGRITVQPRKVNTTSAFMLSDHVEQRWVLLSLLHSPPYHRCCREEGLLLPPSKPSGGKKLPTACCRARRQPGPFGSQSVACTEPVATKEMPGRRRSHSASTKAISH